MSEALDDVAADSSQASSYRRLFGVTLRAQPTNSAVPVHPVVCVGLAFQAGDLTGFCTRKLCQDAPVILSISDDFERDFCFCHAPLCGRFELKQRPSKAPNHSSRTSLTTLITKSSGGSGPITEPMMSHVVKASAEEMPLRRRRVLLLRSPRDGRA